LQKDEADQGPERLDEAGIREYITVHANKVICFWRHFVNSDTFEQLSLDEIEERLYNLESDRAALETALEQKRQQSKTDLAQEVKDLILSRGYEVAEIVDLLTTRRRGVSRARSSRSYIRYVDPANSANVYVRGVLPQWMKEQMVAQGLDPKEKADREAFKEQHLNKMDG
jgi:DNA-binding protein H-NS